MNFKHRSLYLVLGLAIPIAGTLTACTSSSHHDRDDRYDNEDRTSQYNDYDRSDHYYSSEQSTDDATITNRVKSVFYDDSSLNITQINVETHHGVVRLSGYVDKHDQVKRAEADASKVQGVKSVKNDLHVK